MSEKKPWYLSKTIIAATLTAMCGFLVLFGVGEAKPAAKEVGPIADVIIGLLTAIMSAVAIWGRIKANTKITARKKTE